MARRRKPCDFCEDDNYGDYIEHRNGYCLWYEFYPFNQNLSVICQANDSEHAKKIAFDLIAKEKYRKLIDEAERREE